MWINLSFFVKVQFPKGSGGILSYGSVHIGEESKQVFTLKNKGKYPLTYQVFVDR